MTRQLTDEQLDTLADVALDMDQRIAAEDAAAAAQAPDRDALRHAAFEAAAVDVMEGLARQDARSPRDAALAALGPDATEQQIAEWITRFRSEDAEEVTAQPE